MSIPEDAAQPEERRPRDTEETAADTLRPGDALWTGGRWEPVTGDPYTVEDVVHVPTTHDGQVRTRTFSTDEVVRVQRRPHISDDEETAAASTARAGDLVHTILGWLLITLVRVHDPIGAIEIFTVSPQGGGGQAWMHKPVEQLRFRRGDLRHPIWCSRTHCEALDPLSPYHRSEPNVISPPRPFYGPTFTVQLWASSEEPIETSPVTAVLTIDRELIPGMVDARSHDLEVWSVDGLIAALGDVRQHVTQDSAR